MKFFTKDFFSKCGQIRSFSEEILRRKLHFLCSVHAMDPWGPNHYVFGDQSYSKNARKLPLYAGKHMIPWFYLKRTEFAKTCELCSNLNRVLEDPKLKQYSQLRYHTFSSTKMEENMESELSGIFRTTLVPKYIVFGFDPTPNYFCSVMFLSKETYKYREPHRYSLSFFLAK